MPPGFSAENPPKKYASRPNIRKKFGWRSSSRGPGPPERPGGPRETSVLKGFKGACKRPLKLQDDHPLFIDALLQFASVFCTEIAVEKHFDPLKCDFWRASKNFLRSLSLAMFYGPLINYAVIRPLPIVTMER